MSGGAEYRHRVKSLQSIYEELLFLIQVSFRDESLSRDKIQRDTCVTIVESSSNFLPCLPSLLLSPPQFFLLRNHVSPSHSLPSQ